MVAQVHDTQEQEAASCGPEPGLRRVLLELRDRRMLEAFITGRDGIADDLVFPSTKGTVLDINNVARIPSFARKGWTAQDSLSRFCGTLSEPS